MLRLVVKALSIDLHVKDFIRPVEHEIGRLAVVARWNFEGRLPPGMGDLGQGLGNMELFAVAQSRPGGRVELDHDIQAHGIGHRHEGIELHPRIAGLDALYGGDNNAGAP